MLSGNYTSGILTLAAIFCVAMLLNRSLDTLLLGEDIAITVGVNVHLMKLIIVVSSSLITGIMVSMSGCIGFVGLIVPHIARTMIGTVHRRMIPFAMLLGAIFMVLADMFARIIVAPSELPIGVVTALLRCSIFPGYVKKVDTLLVSRSRNMNQILSVKNLSFSVKDRELIHKISFDIPRGSFVGLIGPNGCGKSTLLKTIYRVNQASSGAVYLNGEDIQKMSSKAVARQMAVVTQENDIQFDFSVMELMMIGRYAHRGMLQNRDADDEKNM